MNNIVIIMFLGLSGFILFIFFYMLKRDRVIDSKLSAIELTIEDLNQEMYKIKKSVKNSETQKMLEEMEGVMEKLVENVKKMEEKNIKILKKVEEKMLTLESSVKNKIVDYSHINKSDEQKIIAMFKSGYSVEEISRELRIPAGEVELVIKFQSY